MIYTLFILSLFCRDFKKAELIRVVDGDTIKVNLVGIEDYFGKNKSVRLAEINTPETRTKDKCQKELGLRAKKYVENRLKNIKYVELKDCKWDNFGRHLCTVLVEGKDLSQELLSTKLAYKYKSKNDWCKILKEKESKQ